MLRVIFKEPVNGMNDTICKGISVDPMDESIFLLQFSVDVMWQTSIRNIKHVSVYEQIKPL